MSSLPRGVAAMVAEAIRTTKGKPRLYPSRMGKRIESLDYLRGLLAVSVMAYHFGMVATGLWGKLGLYAVETFFVLSGLVLGLLYPMTSLAECKAFLVKRVFRIAPLFWIATLWGTWLAMDAGRSYHWLRQAANYSLLFGFIAPNGALTKGGWSIGVEMVFYALFPLMAISRVRWWVVGSAILAAWFACTLGPEFRADWPKYVNVLNHLVFFAGGIAMAKGATQLSRRALVSVLIASLVVFVAWPASTQIEMVTGFGRLVLSACTFGVVFAVYHLAPVFQGAPAAVLAFFGRGSYSIYLLHPLVMLTLYRTEAGNGWVAAAATLALSALTYPLLEKPMMRIGAKLAQRVQAPRALAGQPAG